MNKFYFRGIGLSVRMLSLFLILSISLFNQTAKAQCVEVIGAGVNCLSTKTLAINTPLADIDHIEVEATYKSGSAFPTSIQFKTANQTVNQGTADTILPTSKCGSQQTGFYRASLNPASSVTLNVFNNNTTMWSFVAYVVKKSTACSGVKSNIGAERHYLYHCNKEIVRSIPSTTKSKNITVVVPITEMTNDSRIAILTATAGNVSVSKTINTYDLGASLTIQTLELKDVPGNVTAVTIKLESPSTNGDSYLNNSTVVSYVENKCNDIVNKCVEVFGLGAACNTYTTVNIDIPLEEIDHLETEAIYSGYQPSGVNFITGSQNIYKSYSSAIALNNYTNLCYKGMFRATLNADTIVKLKTNSNSCYMQSFVVYVYRKAAYCGEFNEDHDGSENHYVTNCDKSITKSLPCTTHPKTIEVCIPVAEKNDATNTAVISLSAGSQTTTYSLKSYNLNKSLSLVKLQLKNVPGNVTNYSINLGSSSGYCGDNYINGSILSTWNAACDGFDTSDFCGLKKITINKLKVSGCRDHSNFPVLIDISSNGFKANGELRNSNGWDIAFTNEQGKTLPFQIESYNSTTGNFKIWVNVDVVKYASNTVIYMHYGNPSITSDPSSTQTFKDCYKSVYHFNDLKDDSENENHCTDNGGSKKETCKIGDGRSFDGYDDYLKVCNSSSNNITGKKLTISCWMKADVSSTVDAACLTKGKTDNYEQYMLGLKGSTYSNNFNSRVKCNSTLYQHNQGTISNNQWTHVTFVYDGTQSTAQKKTYINGCLVASQSASGDLDSDDGDLYIGKRCATSRHFKGSLDELRISCEASDEDWIKTEYENQCSPSTFYTVTDIKVCTPVPVTLVKFDARMALENEVAVNWMTAMELNNDYFDVERTSDIQGKGTPVARVKGNGTTNKLISYAIMDDVKEVTGDVLYYRLKQVDYDGSVTYTNWVPVNRGRMSTLPVNVYPSPARDYVNVTVLGDKKINVDYLHVLAIDGKDVTSSIHYFVEGNNISVETSQLPSGLYIIHVEGSMGVIRQSLMIEK